MAQPVELKYTMTEVNAKRVVAAVLWKNPRPPGTVGSNAAWVRAKIKEHIVKLVHQYERHQA